MPWLKRFRSKRPKAEDGSPDEVSTSSQPTPKPTVAVDSKGKKPTQQSIAILGQQVCGIGMTHKLFFPTPLQDITPHAGTTTVSGDLNLAQSVLSEN
jgi:hypothetical protein